MLGFHLRRILCPRPIGCSSTPNLRSSQKDSTGSASSRRRKNSSRAEEAMRWNFSHRPGNSPQAAPLILPCSARRNWVLLPPCQFYRLFGNGTVEQSTTSGKTEVLE